MAVVEKIATDDGTLGVVPTLVGGESLTGGAIVGFGKPMAGQRLTISVTCLGGDHRVADGRRVPTDAGQLGVVRGLVGGQKIDSSGLAVGFD